ncbi:MAG TPA: DUF5681 domain-containing protein [Aestuariivirga sp.]|nr:DUF5681 domain-containing protein [Aestuariivirga sp.]
MSVKKKSTKITSGSASGNQAVGYKKPPKGTRFKPGKSGNPLGRPLGSLNKLPFFGSEQTNSIIRAELYREVEVVDGKRKFTVPSITAIAQKLIGKAIAGDSRVAQMMLELGLRLESEERKEYERFVRHTLVYMQLWGEEIASAKRSGREIPDPRPHPSQFVMEETGLLTIRSAVTEETESGYSDHGVMMYTPGVARWFMATLQLPPGKDIRHYIHD